MPMLSPGTLPLALLLVPSLCAAPTASGQVLIADLAGQVTWDKGGALSLLDELTANRTVVLGKDARLVLVHLATGDKLLFVGPGRVRFTAAGKPLGMVPAEVSKHPVPGALKLRPGGMAQISMAMRASNPDRQLVVLPKGPVLLEATPDFAWEAVSPQATYQFKLVDGTGRLWLEQTLSQPSCKVPQASALQEGQTYTWILEARVTGRTSIMSRGRVRVLAAAQQGQLLKAAPTSGSFADRLIYTLLLEKMELGDEARKGWRALAQERPDAARLRILAER